MARRTSQPFVGYLDEGACLEDELVVKTIKSLDTLAATALVKAMRNGVDFGPKPLRVLFLGKHVALVLIPGSNCWSSIGQQSWHPTKVMRRGLPSEKSVYPSGWFPPEHPACEVDVFNGETDGRITQRKVDALVTAAEKHDHDYPALLKRWQVENP